MPTTNRLHAYCTCHMVCKVPTVWVSMRPQPHLPFSTNIMCVTEMSPALNKSAVLMQATEGCDHICERVAIQNTCRCVNAVAEE